MYSCCHSDRVTFRRNLFFLFDSEQEAILKDGKNVSAFTVFKSVIMRFMTQHRHSSKQPISRDSMIKIFLDLDLLGSQHKLNQRFSTCGLRIDVQSSGVGNLNQSKKKASTSGEDQTHEGKLLWYFIRTGFSGLRFCSW